MTTNTIDVSTGAPSLSPPGAKSDSSKTDSSKAMPGTTMPTLSAIRDDSASTSASTRPTLLPPKAGAATTTGASGGVTGTWSNGMTVNGMWGVNETRNAYMSVVGVGWLKIFNGTDAAFTALTTLASQARQTGSAINYRVEADGMVHEIYLW